MQVLVREVADFLGSQQGFRAWLLQRRSAVSVQFQALKYLSKTNYLAILWDATSVTACALVPFRDGSLAGGLNAPTKFVVEVSLTAKLKPAAEGLAGSTSLVFEQGWRVLDGFEVDKVAWPDNSSMPSMHRDQCPWKRQHVFGAGKEVGSHILELGAAPISPEALAPQAAIQVSAFSENFLVEMSNVVIEALGLPAENRVPDSEMDKLVVELLESEEAQSLAEQALKEFGRHVAELGFTTGEHWQRRALVNNPDANGNIDYIQAFESWLQEGSDCVLKVVLTWTAGWDDRFQMLTAHLDLRVVFPGKILVPSVQLVLPHLNLSSKTLTIPGRVNNWFEQLDVTVPAGLSSFTRLSEFISAELVH